MIPPIHHAVWPAHDPIPYTFRANLETWQEHKWDESPRNIARL